MAEGINVDVVEYIDNRPVLVLVFTHFLHLIRFIMNIVFVFFVGHVSGQTPWSIGFAGRGKSFPGSYGLFSHRSVSIVLFSSFPRFHSFLFITSVITSQMTRQYCFLFANRKIPKKYPVGLLHPS